MSYFENQYQSEKVVNDEPESKSSQLCDVQQNMFRRPN